MNKTNEFKQVKLFRVYFEVRTVALDRIEWDKNDTVVSIVRPGRDAGERDTFAREKSLEPLTAKENAKTASANNSAQVALLSISGDAPVRPDKIPPLMGGYVIGAH